MDDKNMSVEILERAAREEKWGFVDRGIKIVCNKSEYLSYAVSNWFRSRDGNVRDLGVSLYEKTDDAEAFERARTELRRMMTFDGNPYVRYRAAFALRRHGGRSLAIKGVITEALGDEEVSEFAKGYLEGDWDEVRGKEDWKETRRDLDLDKVKEVWDLKEGKRK
jgi:hypothetical protein